jgi:ribosomal protein S18 acetylase RimI-like enzyme
VPPIALRRVERADEPFLYAVYASTRAEELAPVPWTEEQKSVFLRMQFAAQHAHYRTAYPGAEFSIVLAANEPVGRLYVDRAARELRLLDISLLPAFRAHGIGTTLMSRLLAEADAAGTPVQLHVEPSNPARRLYERLGFEFVQDVGVYWSMRRQPPRCNPS